MINTNSDIIVSYLFNAGVRQAFGGLGGAIEPLINALAKHNDNNIPENQINTTVTRNEQAAVYMADGYYQETGKRIGMKPAGGIRTAKQAIHYLVMVNETLGSEWLTPDLFRFGASSLLNDLLKQVFKQVSGEYYYDDIFSVD